MNFYNRIFLTALVTISSVGMVVGQTYKNVEITPRTVAGSTANQLSLYTSQFLKSTAPSTNSVSNAVFIRQVGNNNQFTSNVSSVFSKVTAFQEGNNNEAYVQLNAVGVEETVFQRGNNNTFYDIGSDLKLYHRGQVIQQGANQRLLILGNNSLSDRMRVNMQGNNQSVIIRNVKRQ